MFRATLVCLIVSFFVRAVPASDWPMFHHDAQHTGYSTDVSVPSQVEEVWSYYCGGGYSPSIADGVIYLGTHNMSGDDVIALDAESGQLIWSYNFGGSAYVDATAPAVANGIVYVTGASDSNSNGTVYAFNATNGNLDWSYLVGDFIFKSSPTVVNGRVYFGASDKRIYCLDAFSGSEIWIYTTGSYVRSSPAVSDGIVYIGSDDHKLYALNADNGSVLWSYNTDNEGYNGSIQNAPVIADGRVFFSSANDYTYCLNGSDGSVVWKKNIDCGQCTFAYGKIYTYSYGGTIYCLNSSNGNTIWSYNAGVNIASSPIIANSVLYIGIGGDNDADLLALDASTGSFLWSIDYGNRSFFSVPAVANGKIYIADQDYRLYAFGEVADTIPPSAPIISSSSHPADQWSNNDDPSFSWIPPSDDSGISGYSYVLDHSSSTTPDTVSEVTGTSKNYSNVANGTWYFHVRAVDGAGNWGATDHYGPVKIDQQAPPVPVISSSTHAENVWSNSDDPSFTWTVPTDTSGISGYSYEFNSSSSTIPDTVSEVTGTSKNYSNVANGTWYFHVRAVDGAGNWGSTDHYGPAKIDQQAPPAPVISSSTHAEAVWSDSDDPSFAWTSPTDTSGISGYSYELDNSSTTTPDTVSEGTSISKSYSNQANGTWWFHVRAVDGAGNWGSADHYGPVKIDDADPPAPVISSSTHAENVWGNSDDPNFTWTPPTDTSGISGYSYELDNSSTTTPDTVSEGTSISKSYSNQANGTWWFHVRAKDGAGNWGSADHYGPVEVDDDPPPAPVISSSTHAENVWSNSDDPNFTWTPPTDTSGISGYSYELDNSSTTVPDTVSEGTSISKSYSNQANGTWWFHVRAVDGAGNWGATDHYGLVKIDAQEPTTTITLSPVSPDGENGWHISSVQITLSATDGLSGVSTTKYSLDGGSWQVYSTSLMLSDCEHTVEYYSVDNAGNQEDTKSEEINIDTEPPETGIALSGTEGDNGWYVTPVQVTLAPSDICSKVAYTKYRIDSGNWWSYTSPFTLPDCEHTIEYYSMDNAGNREVTKTENVKIDTSAPSANLTLNGTVGENDWYRSDVIVDVESSDNCSGLRSERIKVDGGSEQTPSVTVRTEGIHTVEYYAVDNAGNESSGSSNRDDASVKIDKIPPPAPQISSSTHEQNTWSNNSSVEICWIEPSDVSGISGYSYILDNNPSTIPDENIQTTENCVITSPGDGVWYFHVRAKDNAGWWGNTGHYGPIKIDTQKSTTIISLIPEIPDGNNGWYVSSVRVSLSATDGLSGVAAIKYRIDSGSWQDYSSPFTLSDCEHTIECYSMDNAGNQETTKSKDVGIDTVNPETDMTLSGTEGDNGWYITPVRVTLSPTDDCSGVASTRYRVDNGGWQDYSSPFTLSDCEHIVEYYCVDSAGNTEDIKSQGIKVDTVAPIVSITLNGTAGGNDWYVSDVIANIESSDTCSGVCSEYVKADNGPEQTPPITIRTEGIHTVAYYARDCAGNESDRTDVQVKVDKMSPPAPQISSATHEPDKCSNNNSPEFSWTEPTDTSGIAGYSYEFDRNSLTIPDKVAEGVDTFTSYSNRDDTDNWYLHVRAKDNAGWWGEADHFGPIVIDTIPPSTMISLIPDIPDGDKGWYLSSVQVAFSATDSLCGVASIKYRIDGGSWKDYPSPFTLSDCEHTIEYYSVDNAGNQENMKSQAIKIDTVKPEPTISLSGIQGNNGWYISTVQVTLSATDTCSGVDYWRYRIDGGSWQDYSLPFTLSDCEHKIEYYCVDNAGNQGTTKSEDVRIDTVKPETDIILSGTEGENGWYTTPVQVTLSPTDSCSEVASTQYRVDSGSWQEYSSPFTLSDCEHKVEYYSVDGAGNQETTKSEDFRIDTVKSETDIVLSGTEGENGWYTTPVQVTLSPTDSCSEVASTQYRVDSGSWQEYSSPFTLSDCERNVEYYSVDGAGNTENTKSRLVKVDTIDPSAALVLNGTEGENNWYISDVIADVQSSDSCSGVRSEHVKVDSDPEQTPPITIRAEGTHPVEYYATDYAGNESSGENNRENKLVKIDKKPPPAPQISSSTHEEKLCSNDNSVEICWLEPSDTSGIAGYSYIFDRGTTNPDSNLDEVVRKGDKICITEELEDGIWFFHVAAKDNAGWWGETAHFGPIKIDRQKPIMTISLQPDAPDGENGWYSSPVQVAFSAADNLCEVTSTKYRVDNGSWQDYSSPFTLSDCEHTIEYYSLDEAGNQEDTRSKAVKIDTVKPETAIGLSGTAGNDGWYTSPVQITLSPTDSCSDVAVTRYRIDNGSWQDYSAPFSLSGCRPRLEYFSVDNAGNKEDIKTKDFKIDPELPESTIILSGTEGDNEWYVTPVEVTISALDICSGVASIKYRIDNGKWEDYSAPFTLSDCEHIVEYKSEDNAGNTENIKSQKIRVDTIVPDANVTLNGTVGERDWYISDVTFDVESADGCSGVIAETVVVDGGLEQTLPHTIRTEGVYTIAYYAGDYAGNESSSKDNRKEISVGIDKTPPSAPEVSSSTGHAPEKCSNNDSPEFFWTEPSAISGIAGYSYELDRNPLTIPDEVVDSIDTSESYSKRVDADDWYFHVRGKDNAGHWGETRHFGPVKIDTQPPTASISISGDKGENGWYVSDVVVDCSATDPAPSCGVRECLVKIETEQWQPAPVTISDEGIHAVAFYAVDNAGNESEKDSQEIEIKLDKTLPVLDNWLHTPDPLCRDTEGEFKVQVTVRDEVSGISAIPVLLYEITGGHKDGEVSGDKIGKDTWSFRIPGEWKDLGGQAIIYAVQISDNAGHQVESGERRVVIGEQEISTEPITVNFGTVRVNRTSEEKILTIRNTGCAPLEISGITTDVEKSEDIGGIPTAGFSIVSAGRKDISLTFSPSSEYNLHGKKLTIDSNAPNSRIEVELDGRSFRCEPSMTPSGPKDVTYKCPMSINITLSMEGIPPEIIREEQLKITYTKPNVETIEQIIPSAEGPKPEPGESITHIASLAAEEVDTIGRWTVNANWDGNEECKSAEAVTYFDVNRVPTRIVWNDLPDGPVPVDKPITLSGRVVPDTTCSGTLPGLAGKDVYLQLLNPGGRIDGSCKPKTQSDKTFQIECSLRSVGNWTFDAAWDGDEIYEGCSDRIVLTAYIEPPKAIVVLGGNKEDGDFHKFNYTASEVYSVLDPGRGFRPAEDIYYLNPDNEQMNAKTQVDEVTSRSGLRYAIRDWASDYVGPHTPLLIYLLSHNVKDNFILGGTEDEAPGDGVGEEVNDGNDNGDNEEGVYLTPDELDRWISDLEEDILGIHKLEKTAPVKPVLIMIFMDACSSGSFLKPLAKEIRNQNGEVLIRRIVITSTKIGQPAHGESSDSFSSNFFFRIRHDEYDVKRAFVDARDAISCYSGQEPLLNSDGNKIPNEPSDYANVEGLKIGRLTDAKPPVIENATYDPAQLKAGDSVVFSVEISGALIESVNGKLILPSYDRNLRFDDWSELEKGMIKFEFDKETLKSKPQELPESGAYVLIAHAENPDGHAIPYELPFIVQPVSVDPQGKNITNWGMVKSTKLHQNYPNPFNPETWIPFQLAEESSVALTIYDQQGKVVQYIGLGIKSPGFYLTMDRAIHWNGCDKDGEPLASGIYFYHFEAGDYAKVMRMILLK